MSVRILDRSVTVLTIGRRGRAGTKLDSYQFIVLKLLLSFLPTVKRLLIAFLNNKNILYEI